LELGERLSADHPARIVEDEVNRLDIDALNGVYRGSGSAPHRPDLMLKIAMFEYLDGRTSPAQWTRDTADNQALKWLGRGILPSRTSCYDFRDRMGKVLAAVHAGLIGKAQADELVHPEVGVQDGSTFRAAASRHRLVNRATLEKRQTVLQAAVASDVAGQPVEQAPGWLAKTPSGRLDQAHRMEQAREILVERIAENAKKPKGKRRDEHRIQVNLSEPEAPLGRDKEKVFCPLYTAQFVVEPNSLLVICWDVFAQATDTGTLTVIIDRTQAVVGGRLQRIIADAAYATLLDLQGCQARHIDLIAPVQENSFTHKRRAAANKPLGNRDQFVWLPEQQTYCCPQGYLLSYRGKERKRRRGDQHVIEHRYHCSPEHCRACPLAAGCVRDPSKGRTMKRLEGQELLDAQREKMQRPEIKAEYRQRGCVIERAFADAKGHRHCRRFHGRGLNRAKAEIGLLVLAQNLLTLHRLRNNAANRKDHEP
jgi:transposase